MNQELATVIEYMERERNIGRETLLHAVESALVSAAKKAMGAEGMYRVHIDRKTFEMQVYATKNVVDKVFQPDNEIDIFGAREVDPAAYVGGAVEIEVTPDNFGRIAAQTAKQSMIHELRKVEIDKVFDEYKPREGTVVSGSVRRFDRNDVVVELPHCEAVMRSSERVPTEDYQIGERIQFYILSVTKLNRGAEVALSRSHPNFVRQLFEREVTEIAEGAVEIMGIAREAGFRSKVAVRSVDDKIDPVGACVGMRGIRVKNIVRDLGGEKVDIVRHHTDISQYVTNALAPAKLTRVEIDELTHRIKVIVDDDQLSLAIGKKGQNARLTAKLTGWKIDIQKQEEQMDFHERVELAINELAAVPGIERAQAELLVQQGFLTVEGIMAADLGDLAAVEGIGNSQAHSLKQSAESYYEKIHGRFQN